MNHYIKPIKDFMTTFDQRCYDSLNLTPYPTQIFRAKLVVEEEKEYYAATTEIDILDALVDLIYVIVGTGITVSILPQKGLVDIIDRSHPVIRPLPWLIDELYMNVPCHTRLGRYMNDSITSIEKIAEKRFDLIGAFNCVHENNMQKLWKERPTDDLIVIPKGDKFLVKNKDGKVIKPKDHKKPELAKFIL